MTEGISVRIGTISGTVISMLPNVTSADLLRTMVLAFVGAVVSCGVTLLLKRLLRCRKRE